MSALSHMSQSAHLSVAQKTYELTQSFQAVEETRQMSWWATSSQSPAAGADHSVQRIGRYAISGRNHKRDAI